MTRSGEVDGGFRLSMGAACTACQPDVAPMPLIEIEAFANEVVVSEFSSLAACAKA